MAADLVGVDVAVANRCQEVVDFVVLEVGGEIVQLHPVDVQSLERLFDQLPAADDVLVALLPAEPLADFFARVGGVDEAEVRVQPIARGSARSLRGDDLDDVAITQPGIQRHQPAVDLGADALVANVSVNAIGEVERRGSAG